MADFNEQAYLAANPDVAAAINSGDFSSGAQHYAMYGQAEGRNGSGAAAPAVSFAPTEKAADPTGPQPNWSSGAGYATNITAEPGTPAYYAQINDANAAYRAGVGVNPVTGKLASQEAGTWWNSGSGNGNYLMANPDVMMNYIVNGGAKGIDPAQYALAHSDMGQTGYDPGRQGLLPTGQTTFERLLGREGGSLYNIFGGASGSPNPALLDPRRGIVTSASDRAKYDQTFGSMRGNTGPFAGMEYQDQRTALQSQLRSGFNSLTGSSGGGSSSGSAYKPAPSGLSSGSSSGATGLISTATGGSSTSPVLGSVAPNETTSGQLSSILSTDASGNYTNQLVRQAAERATQAFASRGLLNSSMAVQAAQEAAISKAAEIASQDASAYRNQAIKNQDAQNDFNKTNLTYEQQIALKQIDQLSTDQQTASSLRKDYVSSITGANTTYNNRVDVINRTQMAIEDKNAAIASAASDRDNEISVLNNIYKAMPGWSESWTKALG